MNKIALFRKKQIVLPTFYGWVLIILVLGMVFYTIVKNAHPWLAKNNPIAAQVLIVEGWIPDYALEESFRIFKAHNYQRILTTGGPIATGSYLSDYQTFADLSAESLEKIGVNAEVITALPASLVDTDRTYTSALEVKKWLAENPQVKNLNLVSLGTHARRSFYSFRQSLPDDIELGIISIEDQGYAPERWWRYSNGVRSILYEGMAYFYVFWF